MSDVRVAIDLREQVGPIRDQGARPTCLAFAASDVHADARRDRTPLSCEYVFHHAQRRAGRSLAQGAVLSSMLEAIREDGQPAETDWPYRAAAPDDLASSAPPETVEPLFARDGMRISPKVDEIVQVLDEGQAVIVLLTLSSSFFVPSEQGVIEPEADEQPDPALRHAVVAIGHGSLDGHRVVLVRNSWGKGWGKEGYGWVSDSFLVPRLFAAAKLTGEVNVSGRTVAA